MRICPDARPTRAALGWVQVMPPMAQHLSNAGVASSLKGPESAMLLDAVLPRFDAVRIEHLVVAGDPATVYRAVLEADFLDTWRRSAAVRCLFAARALGERAISALRRRPYSPPDEPASLRLADLAEHGDWVRLGENPPHEVTFGVIGRFWAGETEWETIDAARFSAFDQPGYCKIACSFSLRPYGMGRTLVSYECRTLGTDAAARNGFLRYWRPLSPFIGVVLRAHLRAIARETRNTTQTVL
jgi:hypothetical protein